MWLKTSGFFFSAFRICLSVHVKRSSFREAWYSWGASKQVVGFTFQRAARSLVQLDGGLCPQLRWGPLDFLVVSVKTFLLWPRGFFSSNCPDGSLGLRHCAGLLNTRASCHMQSFTSWKCCPPSWSLCHVGWETLRLFLGGSSIVLGATTGVQTSSSDASLTPLSNRLSPLTQTGTLLSSEDCPLWFRCRWMLNPALRSWLCSAGLCICAVAVWSH